MSCKSDLNDDKLGTEHGFANFNAKLKKGEYV